jgi:predicted O-linked N-acetylglucosamine transferase (SPINDLY family)
MLPASPLPLSPLSDQVALKDVPSHDQIEQLLIAGAYELAIAQCTTILHTLPQDQPAAGLLGLAYLLQGEEEAAQMTWLMAMAEGDEGQVQQWTADLAHLLHRVAEQTTEPPVAWLIRQHLRSIAPNDIDNLVGLLRLSLQLEKFTLTDLTELELLELLHQSGLAVDEIKLLELVDAVFAQAEPDPILIHLVEAVLPHISEPQILVDLIIPQVIRLDQSFSCAWLVVDVIEVLLKWLPDNLRLWIGLATFSPINLDYDRGLEAARRAAELAPNQWDGVFISHCTLANLLGSGGRWQEALQWFQDHHLPRLRQVVQPGQTDLHRFDARRLMITGFLLPYLADQPQTIRPLQNAMAKLVQQSLQQCSSELVDRYQQHCRARQHRSSRPLRVGYLCYAFRQHSVGWLARWLVKHHNRDRVEVYAYSLTHRATEDLVQQQYVQWSDHFHAFRDDPFAVAAQIAQDEIDILVDLDSITFDVSYEIMSLKPAPVQVTWLGWDALGMETIDYYMADPYVLPAHAQDYYVEKIWRLPQTYIAVDGFEVGVPDLRRSQLDIPADAVIFWSGQRGYKRNRPSVELQIEILRQVPNSYLLIKGFSDDGKVQAFFSDIAQSAGVDPQRLRFLPGVSSEFTHRANLAIADVVLDTFPYNGATTTLETLWMGIPLVTQVGEQFSARNSYTLMLNAGITEGIAWTTAEYVEWGVRLGQEADLRQQVSTKLRQARHTAPLWNTRQFAQDMEDAYEQMWKNFITETHA